MPIISPHDDSIISSTTTTTTTTSITTSSTNSSCHQLTPNVSSGVGGGEDTTAVSVVDDVNDNNDDINNISNHHHNNHHTTNTNCKRTTTTTTTAATSSSSSSSSFSSRVETDKVVVIQEDRRSLRLYSKKHRVYIFREFVLKTYGNYLKSFCNETNNNNNNNNIIILDIAGGKGDLSWLLYNIDHYTSIVIDPRTTNNHIMKSVQYLHHNPIECNKRSIPNISTYQPLAALMPILQKQHINTNYKNIKSPYHIRIFVDDELINVLQSILVDQQKDETQNNNNKNIIEIWEQYYTRATQRTVGHVTPSGKNDFSFDRFITTTDDDDENNNNNNTISDAYIALQYILNAKLILGYHPDQATDYCFRLGQLLHIPICVVPCCVFPSEFPNRYLYNDDVHNDDDDMNNNDEKSKRNHRYHNNNSNKKFVDNYDDLIQYLLQQHPYLLRDTLYFPGTTTARRIVLYTLPPPSTI